MDNQDSGNLTTPVSTELNPYLKPTKKPRQQLFAMSVGIVIIGGLLSYFGLKASLNQNKVVKNPIIPTPTLSQETETGPVLIYAETINSIDNGSRTWEVLRISRVIGNNPPEVLIPSIGAVGEFPSDFKISPDKTKLLVNLENKIEIYNLITKKLQTAFTLENGKNSRGVNFSPDSQQLFIWDTKYGDTKGFSLYLYNLATGQKRQLTEIKGDRPQPYYWGMFVKLWRSDNKIILGEPAGDASRLWIYDLATNTLTKKPSIIGELNSSGTIMAVPNYSIDYPCPSMGGGETGSYSLVDPITLTEKGKIGNDTKVITSLYFSPNGNNILYSTIDPINSQLVKDDISMCDVAEAVREKTLTYFTQSLNSQPQKVKNYVDVLKNWNTDNVGATIGKHSSDGYYINLNGLAITKPIALDVPTIIAQYYQWKTYTNLNYKFSIMYPYWFNYQEITVTDNPTDITLARFENPGQSTSDAHNPEIDIRLLSNPQNLSLDKWLTTMSTTKNNSNNPDSIDQDKLFWSITQKQNLIINGNHAIRFSSSNGASTYQDNVVIQKGDKILLLQSILTPLGDYKNLFDQMILTVKFTMP